MYYSSASCNEYFKDEFLGKKVGKLTILDKTYEGIYLCKCVCGSPIIEKTYQQLKERKVTHCGCVDINKKKTKFLEKRFSRLLVVGYAGDKEKWGPTWVCLCDCCNVILVPSSNLINGNTKSCGCLRRQVIYGKDNPDWQRKEFSTNKLERKRSRNLKVFKVWKSSIHKRDNYTCQTCNCKEEETRYLVAHHLLAFHKHPELRYNKENGITMCVECHDEFHDYDNYGSTDFTVEDWIEFRKYKLNLLEMSSTTIK